MKLAYSRSSPVANAKNTPQMRDFPVFATCRQKECTMRLELNVNRELAEKLATNFLAFDQQLDELLRQAQPNLGDEVQSLRRSVGEVLGLLYMDVMKNIDDANPDLKPEGMP